MIVEKINKYLTEHDKTLDEGLLSQVSYLAKYAFQRQFMQENERASGKLYLSASGKCQRAQSYKMHTYPENGKEMDSRAKIVFWLGDLAEFTVIGLAKCAGCQISSYGLNQNTVYFKVGEVFINGHPDGLLIEPSEIMLLEVKSMASYTFERFEKGEIDDAYLDQIQAYLEATGIKRCVLVALNKESGVIGEAIINKDPARIANIKARFQRVMDSTSENLPEPEHAMDAKGFYPWQCLYCSYWGWCRPNAEKVLFRNSYKLKEKGVPDETAKKGKD